MAYPLDETVSTAWSDLDNAGRLPSSMSSFLGHVHRYRSALLKQNTDLAYYCSNQSVEIDIQGCMVDEGQVSDIRCHASRPARAGRGISLLMPIFWYRSMVCSSVEVISIRFLVREKFEK